MRNTNAGYEVNHVEEKIIVSKSFAKAAGVLNTAKYKILRQLREENPSYSFELREIKHKAGKVTYRNLTYKHMREYISEKEGKESASLDEMETVIGLSHVQDGQYAYVKTWFLNKYPELKKESKDAVDGENDKSTNVIPMVKKA